VTKTIHNVRDDRHGWIGAWETEPLDAAKLTEADVGRTVIYRDQHRAEAGTLTSWRGNIVFARYSRGDTASGANAANLVFGISRADNHPDAPGRSPVWPAIRNMNGDNDDLG